MATPHRIAILGGGMASLAAAYKLASHPKAEALFEITVYQIGWRLGGKCASSRAPFGKALRVEEHGLHVWFGCYANAFHMLRDCYKVIGREDEMEKLFTGQTDTPYMDDSNDWDVWPVHFPRKHGKIGVDSYDSGAYLFGIDVLDFAVRTSRQLLDRAHDRTSITEKVAIQTARANSENLTRILEELQQFLDSSPQSQPPDTDKWTHVVENSISARALLFDLFPDPHAVRRKLIEADLAWTTMVGIKIDGILFNNDWDAIDYRDFRSWLRFHGARPETLDSPPVRALYDLCFAYVDGIACWSNANFAAGAALNTVSRIALDYVDYVVYEMRAGMGDMVIAPIYDYLTAKKVNFKFFHRITRLEPTYDKRSVAAIHFERQATVAKEPYKPLIRVPSPLGMGAEMWAWPSEPDNAQIVENIKGVDLESIWNGLKGKQDSIVFGKHFDSIILGISVDEVKEICREFHGLPGWNELDQVKTVETVSAQLWLTKTVENLGWKHGRVPVDAAPEPLDVWADRSEILDCEIWPDPKPVSVQYFCGPFSGDYASHPTDPTMPVMAKNAAYILVANWLNAYAYTFWPHGAVPGSFDWTLISDPKGGAGAARLKSQYVRTNISPSERYVLSVAGSTKYRLASDNSQLSNLYLAGDWTHSKWNAGCVETAVTTGFNAATALAESRGIKLP